MKCGMRRHGPMTTSDLEYISKFYEIDGPSYVAAALDISPESATNTYLRLKKNNQIESFKKLKTRYVEVM